MTFVALWIPDWPTGAAANELMAALLAVAPRAALAPADSIAWVDARSLDVAQLTARVVDRLRALPLKIGGAAAALVPIAAAVACRRTPVEPLLQIAPHRERSYLFPLPLSVLDGDPATCNLLHAVGITRCGQLAELSREAVEVRFGSAGLALWRKARGDNPRPIFSARPRELPTASLDWTEFSTSDIEQLEFVLHSLLRTVCDALEQRGTGASEIALTLTLENHQQIRCPVQAARVTAQRTTWLRLVRRSLQKIELPDRITGLAVEVVRTGAPLIRQGDLFDTSFASLEAAERTVAQILDLQDNALVEPTRVAHVLPERRVRWTAAETAIELIAPSGTGNAPAARLALTLQLLMPPRAIEVRTTTRRGFDIPLLYIDNGTTHPLSETLGPQCRSGDRWDEPFAREYYQGVRRDGSVALLFHDVLNDQWFLSGEWN